MPGHFDQHLKRLDHLQAMIQRLAGNSFLIKGWAITLVTAILGFALKDPARTASLAWFGIVPTLVFWGLDGYYLAVERAVRIQYNASSLALKIANYLDANVGNLPDPDIKIAAIGICRWLQAAFTRATFILYLALLAVVVAVGSGIFTFVATKVVIAV
jgi:hypothetical protein